MWRRSTFPGPGPSIPRSRVIRRKDLDDLFDTDSDLTGFDVDISPYVRDAEDTDIRVFWREMPVTGDEPPKPTARELCAVPIGQARKWIQASRKAMGTVFFVRDPQWRRREGVAESGPPGWVPFREAPWPGLTLLADVGAGGYREDLGFTGNLKHKPLPVDSPEPPERMAAPSLAGESGGHDEDPRSEAGHPVALADHLRHVAREVSQLCSDLGLDARDSLAPYTCRPLARPGQGARSLPGHHAARGWTGTRIRKASFWPRR